MPQTIARGPRIRRFNAQFEPGKDWEEAGRTPWGAQLYRVVEKRSGNAPEYETGPDGDILTDHNGNPVRAWVRSEISGQKLYPKNRPTYFTIERLFYAFDEGNGNVRMEPYRPPTPEEIEAAKRAKKIEAMQAAWAEKLADSDMSLDELFEAFMRGPTQELEYADPPSAEDAANAVEIDLKGGQPDGELAEPQHKQADTETDREL